MVRPGGPQRHGPRIMSRCGPRVIQAYRSVGRRTGSGCQNWRGSEPREKKGPKVHHAIGECDFDRRQWQYNAAFDGPMFLLADHGIHGQNQGLHPPKRSRNPRPINSMPCCHIRSSCWRVPHSRNRIETATGPSGARFRTSACATRGCCGHGSKGADEGSHSKERLLCRSGVPAKHTDRYPFLFNRRSSFGVRETRSTQRHGSFYFAAPGIG